MVVVIRNTLTDNELRCVSRLPEMAGRLFVLLIVRAIRYTLLKGEGYTNWEVYNCSTLNVPPISLSNVPAVSV